MVLFLKSVAIERKILSEPRLEVKAEVKLRGLY